MATAEEIIGRVVAEFDKQFTSEEKKDFEGTTVQDVWETIRQIQRDQESHTQWMNFAGVRRFMNAMNHLNEAMQDFGNMSSLSCYVWGPTKHILMTLSAAPGVYSLELVLLEAYYRLGEKLALIYDETRIPGINLKFYNPEVIIQIYEDGIKFHLKVVQLCRSRIWTQLFRSSWLDYQPTFEHLMNDIILNYDFLFGDTAFSKIEEWRQARLDLERSFATLESERKQREMHAVLAWLVVSNPCSISILDYCINLGQDDPAIGRWILDEPKVRDWLKQINHCPPYLWIHDNPGTGKLFLASNVIQETYRLSRSSRRSSVAHFFWPGYGPKPTFSTVASILLSRLLPQSPELPSYLYGEVLASSTPTISSPRQYAALLDIALQAVPNPVIILDSIDEYDEGERKLLLDFFATKSNGNNTGAGNTVPWCLFFSRELDQIKEILPMVSVLELEDQHLQQNVQAYVAHQSVHIQEKFDLSEELTMNMIRIVCGRAGGNILRAVVILERFKSRNTKKNFLSMLRNENERQLYPPFREDKGRHREGQVSPNGIELIYNLEHEDESLTQEGLSFVPELKDTAFLSEGFLSDANLIPCPTVVSRDSGYGSMAPRVTSEGRRRKKMDSEEITGEVEEWDTRSVASLESHATDITMSSVNPAAAGGAAEQFANVLLLNDDIRSLLAEGFQTMESDKFERNFRRLLKDYASSLRKEAKDTLEKGATKIVHTYRAYVTRIIRSKIVETKVESQALAFHKIKSQETSKFTLERFLEQFQVPRNDTVPEENKEDLESEAGSKFSDDEQPYLPNIEKVTDFLVSSVAFEAFQQALCAFVRPVSGHRNTTAQAPSRQNTQADDSMQTNPQIIPGPSIDELQVHVSKKRPTELHDGVENDSKRLKIGQEVNEEFSPNDNSLNTLQSSPWEFMHTESQGVPPLPSKAMSAPVGADVDMPDIDDDYSIPPVSENLLHYTNLEGEKDVEHTYRVGRPVIRNQAHFSVRSQQMSDAKSFLGSPISQSPHELTSPLTVAERGRTAELVLNDQDLQSERNTARISNRFAKAKAAVNGQEDAEPAVTLSQSMPDQHPLIEMVGPPQVEENTLHGRYKFKNALKRLFRPPVSPGFQRIEWICACGDLLYADFSKKCPEKLATISSQLRIKPAHSMPLFDNTVPSNNSMGQTSMPPAGHMGHITASIGTMKQGHDPGFNIKSKASNQLELCSTGSSSQSASLSPAFFELCVNAGTFLKSLAEIDLKDTRTDGEFFQAVKEHYFRMRS